jgi:hypothetical protein
VGYPVNRRTGRGARRREGRRLTRHGWFRRNRWALLAILVLLPATLGIMFVNQWVGYFAEWPSRPVRVAVGESVEYADARRSIESVDRIHGASAAGQDRGLPTGTDLVVVTLTVDPTGSGPVGDRDLCTVWLAESGGPHGERKWSNASTGAISPKGPRPELVSCSSELNDPYSFVAEFVVPVDAGKSTTMTVGLAVAHALPAYASFALD